MTMRITGMNSGLDTEAIISELVKAKRVNQLEIYRKIFETLEEYVKNVFPIK